jgi:ABC-type transport system involved in multi-copper enzyme maturation permease subunit
MVAGRVSMGYLVGAPAYPWHHPSILPYNWRTWNSLLRVLWAVLSVSAGVPLVCREIERGTVAFAWTQGIPKSRWLLGKLLTVAGVLGLAAAAFGVLYGWWFDVLARAGIGAWSGFALYAPALVGWTLAGVTLGACAGALLRQDGRAFAAGLPGYWGLAWAVSKLRAHYLPLLTGPARTSSLVVGRHAGLASYQPAGRFWLFEFMELALLLGVCALLIAGTIRLLGDSPFRRFAVMRGRDLAARRMPAERRPRAPMVRAAWRLHRGGLLAVFALLGGIAVALVVTGVRLHGEPGLPGQAEVRSQEFARDYGLLLDLVPFVLGACLGAPLVAREMSRGTARFAWTQGIGRARWLGGQLTGVGLALAAATISFGLVFQWWAAPLARGGLAFSSFVAYAPALTGWTLLSLAVGVLCGVICRQPGGAALLTATILAVLAGISYLWRGYLLPTMTSVAPTPQTMPTIPVGASLITYRSMPGQGLQLVEAVYQPFSRFWALQFADRAVTLGLAVLLGAASLWLVRRSPA